MSAYLVSPKQIGVIAAYAHKSKCTDYGVCYGQGVSELDTIAKCLAQANIDSIESRYPDTKKEGAAQSFCSMTNQDYIGLAIQEANNAKLSQFTPAIMATLCANFEYQACEVDNWFESLAFKILIQVRRTLVEKLPGYENAPWGIN